jgi:hypothetical protein
MAGDNKVDSKTKQERVYKVSLMLRRKSIFFILDYIRLNWGLERAQAFNYIKEAKNEWQKYFSQIKKCGKSYYVAQLRDLKDEAYERKIVIGKGDNKEAVTVADLGLVFEITKEEAKLMGIYPSTKEDITVKHSGEINSQLTHILKMEDEELNELIKRLSKTGIGDSPTGTEEKRN